MEYVSLILLAMWSGYMEQIVYRGGYHGFGKKVLMFHRNYHLPLFAGWLYLCWIHGAVWFIGIFIVIEDWSWFMFHPRDELDPGDWVSKPLGGFWVKQAWIPFAYLVWGVTSGILYFIT